MGTTWPQSWDEVRIEWRPSGSLRLSAETTTVRKRRRVDIELDEIGSEFLFDHLIGAYLSGADRIRLSSRKAIKRSDRRIIRRFIQATRGIEISHETDFIVEMIALLNTSEMPLHSSINRMYLIVSSQIRDVSEVLSGGINHYSVIAMRERKRSTPLGYCWKGRSGKSLNQRR